MKNICTYTTSDTPYKRLTLKKLQRAVRKLQINYLEDIDRVEVELQNGVLRSYPKEDFILIWLKVMGFNTLTEFREWIEEYKTHYARSPKVIYVPEITLMGIPIRTSKRK